MTPFLRIGQSLQGQAGFYTIGKQIQKTVWLAKDKLHQPVFIKSVHHFRLQNERDIMEPSDPPAIVLKHLDDNLLNASTFQKLTRSQIKHVAKSVLEALSVLHAHTFVHTDFGSTVPASSAYAKDGNMIGAPIWRSPEVHLRIGWGTAPDIWSFGATLISLLYGNNFFLFKPDVSADHEDYDLRILQRQCEFLGPFPLSYREICPPGTLDVLARIMRGIPPERKRPFTRISEKELRRGDKEFIVRIMRLDPRERPSAVELLRVRWFEVE
ncbi:putative serine/threonine protein kinase [Aspergillus homomorphus CBS 101889]|uniref:Kinase-like protein n=1 Tax=Aspergillus homomorphus (strain CBS 101889) TaxID=1450537 RepID=A0A395HMR6_ASPHC|nr:kinase-like protein [Aspergillus homomorphus CBS 101889]RAL08545.1 kinase-like protein [Aspergillus homomorphus CBS 101889]